MTIKSKIQNFINIISNYNISLIKIEIDNNIILMIEKIIKKYNNLNIETNNIRNYTKQLININTNKKCLLCPRLAEFKNIHSENEIYCWIHAQ